MINLPRRTPPAIYGPARRRKIDATYAAMLLAAAKDYGSIAERSLEQKPDALATTQTRERSGDEDGIQRED